MICKNCGTDCPEGSMSCVTCGAPLFVEQQYAQQQYAQPQYAPYPTQQNIGTPGKGLGIAAMVLGIIAIVFLCVPVVFAGYISIFSAIIGIILAACGMVQSKKAGKSNGMAIAGLVCSIVALAITILAVIVLAEFLAELSRWVY